MDRRTPRITDFLDEARRLDEMVAAMGGDPLPGLGARTAEAGLDSPRTPQVVSSGSDGPVVVGVHWLMALLERLEKRVAALEAERTSRGRSRKCPRCQASTLEVITTGPHPEFGFAGIEEHEVRCDSPGCGYRGKRLYDPNDYIC